LFFLYPGGFYFFFLVNFFGPPFLKKNQLGGGFFFPMPPPPPPPPHSPSLIHNLSSMISFYTGPAALEVSKQSAQSINKPTNVTEVVRATWERTTQSTQRNETLEENDTNTSQTIPYILFGVTILLLALCFVLCFWWSHRKRNLRSFILVTCTYAFYLD